MIFNLGGNEAVTLTAENVKYNDSNVADELIELETRASALEDELTANGTRIYLDYKDGKYGYNTSASRGADTFSPFSSDDEFNNLTTAIDITANNLPSINGSGYIYVKYLSGAVNTISVYIDGNTSPFKFKNFSSNIYQSNNLWKFYFQKSIRFSYEESSTKFMYQTLLSDSLVDEKYRVRQGATSGTNSVTIPGKGKIIISQPLDSTVYLYYQIDGGNENYFSLIYAYMR